MFRIVTKEKDPWWYPPVYDSWAKGLKPVPPGPSNPLGTRWMGLSAAGVGIHGTDAESSIGYSLSHGCIRMHVPEAEWLFEHVRVGTPVVIL
jgi:lipoprotein-anchoring transpeptidase ErfK/SrfK